MNLKEVQFAEQRSIAINTEVLSLPVNKVDVSVHHKSKNDRVILAKRKRELQPGLGLNVSNRLS